MPPEKQQRHDAGDLLDDIHFINQSARQEISRIENRFRQRIDAECPEEKLAGVLLDEISMHLGQLTAKVMLADQAIRSLQSKLKPEKDVRIKTPQTAGNNPSADLIFPVDQLAENKNLLPMEWSPGGVNYCWSGVDPQIRFSFALDRSKALGMQIRLFALIKPEYSKQLKVMIDDKPVRHWFALDGQLFVVSCVLPPADKTSQTSVTVVLPGTHSPTDLGGGLDGRKLGIAISEIRFGKPESGFGHLLKRLRLKK